MAEPVIERAPRSLEGVAKSPYHRADVANEGAPNLASLVIAPGAPLCMYELEPEVV